ncbi:MAG: hypothetical protein JXN63_08185 [Candidatus Delongbacteria bacterium]|nr:hypothetical protein [Candidatus Delongbacteria bacterium]
MTKNEIVNAIGTTDVKRFITKTNNQIQGAEKEFWYDLDYGTKLEVWTYKYDRGTLNLYFIGESADLKYKIFTNK